MKVRIKKTMIVIFSIIIFCVISSFLFCFSVQEKEDVIITQFGRVIKSTSSPGLHFKLPAPIQNVLRFSKKLKVFESIPTEILTQDKKNLLINNYVIWNIKNPLLFYKTVKSVKRALVRLEDIVYSQMRNEVGLYTFSEIIASKREQISLNLTRKVQEECAILGVDVVDIKIKKVSFPSQNLNAIYRRMIAERKKMATKYRSEGEEEAIKIRSETDKEKTIILAKSYRESEAIKGEGEAVSMKNYARVIRKDIDYYKFTRSMEVYSEMIKENSTVILSTDSELLKYFKPPKK